MITNTIRKKIFNGSTVNNLIGKNPPGDKFTGIDPDICYCNIEDSGNT